MGKPFRERVRFQLYQDKQILEIDPPAYKNQFVSILKEVIRCHPFDTGCFWDEYRDKIEIEVIDILGTGQCSMEQKIGDKYQYPEDRGKMCASSLHILYPWILVMQSGGSFSFFEDGHSVTLGCADYEHQVVYRITRIEVD